MEQSILQHTAVAVPIQFEISRYSKARPLIFRMERTRLAFRDGGKHIRENETITVRPFGVLGVEVHHVPENVGHGGHAHRSTGVTGVGLSNGINLIAR